MINKKCLDCGKQFVVSNYRIKTAKYCSDLCRNKNWVVPKRAVLIKKGQHLSISTEFKKGDKRPKKEKSPYWKGNKATFSGVHIWVLRNWIKHKKCDFCKQKKRLDWANIDHKYNRVRKDWLCLCRSCHQNYDFKMGLRKLS